MRVIAEIVSTTSSSFNQMISNDLACVINYTKCNISAHLSIHIINSICIIFHFAFKVTILIVVLIVSLSCVVILAQEIKTDDR